MNKYMTPCKLMLLTILTHLSLTALADDQSNPPIHQTWKSKPTTVSLIELYTSEGCHSCPPAERWVNTLTNHPALFKDFIPVVFHVDYWDYLGWKDRFANDEHSRRQRTLKREGIFSGVYTPGVTVASQEWHGWRRQHAIPMSDQKAGVLTAEISPNNLTVSFERKANYTLNIAYLGMGLSTEVTAGENNRKTLQHEFVVLKHWQEPGVGKWDISLPPVPDKQQARNVLAIWITENGSERVVQAVGGYLR